MHKLINDLLFGSTAIDQVKHLFRNLLSIVLPAVLLHVGYIHAFVLLRQHIFYRTHLGTGPCINSSMSSPCESKLMCRAYRLAYIHKKTTTKLGVAIFVAALWTAMAFLRRSVTRAPRLRASDVAPLVDSQF